MKKISENILKWLPHYFPNLPKEIFEDYISYEDKRGYLYWNALSPLKNTYFSIEIERNMPKFSFNLFYERGNRLPPLKISLQGLFGPENSPKASGPREIIPSGRDLFRQSLYNEKEHSPEELRLLEGPKYHPSKTAPDQDPMDIFL